jgi:hypothetical protein
MDTRCLNDKNEYPDDEVLARYLGKSKHSWDAFIELLKTDHPSISTEWRYYNDGKSWLFKVTKKAKTICWISVWEGFFKVTFYFNMRAEEAITKSLLDEAIKEQWLRRDNIGKIKPITIDVKKKTDLKVIQLLIELKSSIK